jgi:circadian clock protein KaiB
VTEAPETTQQWVLRLYVNGASPQSVAAIDNIRRICDEELAGQVAFDVVDVRTHPALVIEDRVIAAPTLIKRLPGPLRQLVGDLSDADRVRRGLDLGPVKSDGGTTDDGSAQRPDA